MIALALFASGCGEGPRAGWKSDFVEANGIRLHYWRTGEGPLAGESRESELHDWRTGLGSNQPVIVLAHGITDNALCWSSLVMDMASRYDFVFYDARGHGLSDKPETGYGMEDHVADLVGLIQALELDKPLLMGHSMGGAAVAMAVAQHPDLALAAVLVDPAWLRTPDDPAKQLAEFRTWFESVQGKSVGDLMDIVADENPDWPFEDWKPWAESKTQMSPKVLQTIGTLPVLEEIFPRIRIPVLILKADAEEAERERNLRSAELLPNGLLDHIDGAGHSVHRDKPIPTRQAVHQFMRGRPLWEMAALYRRTAGYSIEVSAEGRYQDTRENVHANFTFTRTFAASGSPASTLRYEDTGTEQPPKEFGENVVPTQWLEIDRAPKMAAEINGFRGSGSIDRNGEETRYRRLTGQTADGERYEYWVARDTGHVGRFVLNGTPRWTLTINREMLDEAP